MEKDNWKTAKMLVVPTKNKLHRAESFWEVSSNSASQNIPNFSRKLKVQ
jgi:hypothetical protein